MSTNYNITDKSRKRMSPTCETMAVPQVSYKMAILAFMAEHEIPLQPKSIYGGLIHQQNITFSYRTVQNKVAELVDEGYLKPVEIDEGDGVVREISDTSGRRCHYLITQSGIEHVEDVVL